MSTVNTETAYQFDGKGYYLNETLVQKVGEDDYLVPPDTTLDKPTFKDGYWAKWNGKKWANEKIPTTCAEAIKKDLTCISNGQGKHNYEVKILLEALVAADSENYRTVITDDFVMSIEAISDKEKQTKEDEATQAEIQSQLAMVKADIETAIAPGNDDWLKELRTAYNKLLNNNQKTPYVYVRTHCPYCGSDKLTEKYGQTWCENCDSGRLDLKIYEDTHGTEETKDEDEEVNEK